MASPRMRAAAAQYINAPIKLTHTQEVMRMYRKSLRLLMSWAIDREIFNAEGLKIRAAFDKYKDLPLESGKVKTVMRYGYEQLKKYTHPDPYIPPWMPGGSLFMRNPPLPFAVVFPNGIPDDVHEKPVNIDLTPVPKGHKTRVLVDSANKTFHGN